MVLKPAPGPPKRTVEQQREQEGQDLLSRLDMGKESLVVLDERGEMLTSHQFADYLQKCADDGVQAVTFAIGGASGHSPEVQRTAKQNGKYVSSLGRLVCFQMSEHVSNEAVLMQDDFLWQDGHEPPGKLCFLSSRVLWDTRH